MAKFKVLISIVFSVAVMFSQIVCAESVTFKVPSSETVSKAAETIKSVELPTKDQVDNAASTISSIYSDFTSNTKVSN
ncbi:MAG: hypothetical protein SFT91_03555 [Rickettsiaceae bacterium]|nr:hypothetical protein [Rickettsiaceae bacterium]